MTPKWEKVQRRNDIFNAVYDIVRLVPRGRVTSYGAVAAAIGLKSGARLVGYAMNLCHAAAPDVPAHRVVNHTGLLTGRHHFSTPSKMQELLQEEGIEVENDAVKNFKEAFWNPVHELNL
jgi:methylated-DNA-protein-cysteine methyltransferase related protein